MKKFNLLFMLTFLPFAIMIAEGDKRIMESLSMKSAVLGQEVKYSIVLPVDYHKGKKVYPVVYLLHGLGDDESSWLEYGRIAQIADAAVAGKEIVEMIFVIPQGFRNYYVNDYASTFLYEDMFVYDLVPFIDSVYRTIPDKAHRATMGYSMGGFGALILPVRHPDVFQVSVPLSISVRTDEQYMVEDASEWNNQWGRLFGGVGTIGEERITDYYKQYSAFHLFKTIDSKRLEDLKIFIDNGDDEYTLCRSNEELHILLRDLQIQHEYRVRDGGHSFTYWRASLPNALCYISDSFENKVYRGDLKRSAKKIKYPKSTLVQKDNYAIALPPGYRDASRLYPVVYIYGIDEAHQRQRITDLIRGKMSIGTLPSMILVFLMTNELSLKDNIISTIETDFNARVGYRFRALVGVGDGGVAAMQNALIPDIFTACVLFNSPIDTALLKNTFINDRGLLKKMWLYISTTDADMEYNTNGMAHILLREEDIYHEYRVFDSEQDDVISDDRLSEAFQFLSAKIHR